MKRTFVVATVAGSALLASGALLARRNAHAGEESNPNAAVPYGKGVRIDRIVTIARSPHDVYAAWRDFESLPLVMPNLERVDSLPGSPHSRWTAKGVAGASVSWNAVIIEDVPGHRISWRADDAPIVHAGTITFAPAPGNRGTEVRLEIEFVPPAGPLGALALKLNALPPRKIIDVDLRRFKSIMESGDYALNGTDVTE